MSTVGHQETGDYGAHTYHANVEKPVQHHFTFTEASPQFVFPLISSEKVACLCSGHAPFHFYNAQI